MIRFNTTNYGSLFGYSGYSSNSYSNTLYSGLSLVSSVKSGAYSKALKALYGKNKNNSTYTSAVLKNSKYKYDVDSELSSVKRESGELADSVKKLTDTGKNNLFADKEKYDSDAAYKAVSEFVTNYNETVAVTDKLGNSAIDNAVNSMKRLTGIMGKSLSKAGISIDVDGKMFTGDTIMPFKPYFNGRDSNEEDWKQSVSNIKMKYSNDTQVYPGHGDTLTLGEWIDNYCKL